MRTALVRIASVFAVVSALSGCGGGAPPVVLPGDGGGDGSGPNVDRMSRPVLSANLGLDLADVGSFAYLTASSSGPPLVGGGSILKANDGGADDASMGDAGGPSGGGGLYALTLSGEALSVNLVDEGNPNAVGSPNQPMVAQIYATATWVLFNTPGFVVQRSASDGGFDAITCNMIVARRSDGALYCSPFAGRPSDFDLDRSLQANAAGDVVYLAGYVDTTGTYRLFRLSLGGAGGPTAVALTPATAMAFWFVSNADGDVLHVYAPSPLAPMTTLLDVAPADGSAAIPLGNGTGGLAVTGLVGDVDANTFYLMVGGGGGIVFTGAIRVFTKQGTSFTSTDVVPNLPNVVSYGTMLRLADGIYLFSRSDKALVRIFAGGTAVATPTPVPIVGVDSFLDVAGGVAAPAGGQVMFLANTPTGQQFIRHDGVTQQNIPIPTNIALTKVMFAPSGAIDFIGVRTDTQETVRGSVEVGSTSVVLATTGVLAPDRIVVLTRIN